MTTDPWQRYQQLYQSFAINADVSVPAERLLNIALQLSKQRQACAVSCYDNLHLTAQQLSTPLWRVEVLMYLADCYQLHPLNRHLLLLAGCCSALVSAVQTSPLLYPALSAAKQLKLLPRAAGVVQVLSGCYASERKHAHWLQNLLSLLLTQSKYLTNDCIWPAQLANRLMLSQSDYELQILNRLIKPQATEQPAPPQSFAHLQQHSCVAELRHYDNKALEHYLSAQPKRAVSILALASQLNRQQQNIQSVKLALGIIGWDTLPTALALAELEHYLNALHHPWQDVFSQFYHVLSQAMQMAMPQLQCVDSHLLALCCCAPLWLNPLYQRTPLVKRTAAGYYSAFTPAQTSKNDTYLPQVTELLQLYQLEHYTDAVTALLTPRVGQRINTVGLQLQLAWHSTLVLYCAMSVKPVETLLHKTGATGNAKLTTETWLQQLAQRSQCYYPICFKL